MIRCRINITKNNIEKSLTVYGLDFMENEKVICHIPDITPSFNKIKRNCDLINRNNIKKEHIPDIVEDMLE